MDKQLTRKDDYEKRREHLTNLSDEQLKEHFWKLADDAVQPLIDLAQKHTSPAIERSVLLRMGFSSLEAAELVKMVINHNLIGKGAGHVVFRYSRLQNISIRDAGLALMNDMGWNEVLKSFEVAR